MQSAPPRFSMLISLLLGLGSLVFFLVPIVSNRVVFDPDELYWISTGRIVPLLLTGNTTHPFWNEYYGYANFNGAKLLYGIGLAAFGHTDYAGFVLPPQTYYRFAPYGGKAFPANHPLSGWLRDGRIIAALFAAASVGLLFIWLSRQVGVLMAAASSVVFALHPLVTSIAAKAFADSMFMAFFLLFFVLMDDRGRPEDDERLWTKRIVFLGITLAIATSIKLNAFLLAPLLFWVDAWFLFTRKKEISPSFLLAAKRLGVVLMVAAVTFALLHPNFFFYPRRSPWKIVADRLEITADHMAYFGARNPQHVLYTIPGRAVSLVRHAYAPGPLAALLLVGQSALVVLLFTRRKKLDSRILATIGSFVILLISTLVYVVFDEGRYFLPLLPHLFLFASFGYGCFLTYISKIATLSSYGKWKNPNQCA